MTFSNNIEVLEYSQRICLIMIVICQRNKTGQREMYKRTEGIFREDHRIYTRVGGKRSYMGVKSNDKPVDKLISTHRGLWNHCEVWGGNWCPQR